MTSSQWLQHRDEDRRAVQRRQDESAEAGPIVRPEQRDGAIGELDAVAQRGVSGPSQTLPHGEAIQRSFGHHDVSHVAAHVGGEATPATAALGAEAYASGSHVAFRQAPSLHTAAHEAAHVVQQRAGVACKGLDGGTGDRFEQHADQVADAVVRGESAAPLLDRMPAAGGQAGPTIQRQVAPAAPDVTSDDDATDSYQPSWDDVVAAAQDDDHAKQALDVAWIDALPGRMQVQIDGSFSVGKEHAAFALMVEKDAKARALKSGYKDATRDLDKAHKGTRKTPGISDTEYDEKKQILDTNYAESMGERKKELEEGFNGKKKSYSAEKSVIKAPKGGVSWAEGRLIARVNFMAWGINLLGSADKVKAHFQGLRAVNGIGKRGDSDSELVLADAAATRLEATRAWFEQKHPGHKMLGSTVGQSLRGRHQGSHSRGMQGHPLGFSADFDATVNVHQTDTVGKAMLAEFGGGSTSMDLGASSYEKVRELGRDTAAGRDPGEKQLAFLAAADKQFDAMSQGSEQFREALGDAKMDQLREAQALYYSVIQPGRQRLAALDKAEAKAKKSAADATDKDAAQDDGTSERDTLAASVAATEAKVQAIVDQVFAEWKERLNSEIEHEKEGISDEDLELKVDRKTAHAALDAVEKVKKHDGVKGLRRVMTKKAYAPIFASFTDDIDALEFSEAKDLVVAHASRVSKARWHAGEAWIKEQIIARLSDLRSVFGTAELKEDKHTHVKSWQMKREVKDPSVAQYLQLGYARNDGETDKSKKTDVFNTDFMHAMLLHGWYPGAAWAAGTDTMHFDFLDGYAQIVGSGKSFGPTD